MARRSRLLLLLATSLAILLMPLADSSFAQINKVIAPPSDNSVQLTQSQIDTDNRRKVESEMGRTWSRAIPGGYLSVIKLGFIALLFLVWVRMADWINRDTMKIGDRTGMSPLAWNPIVVFSFLIGFLSVISVPIFYAGITIYCIAIFVPWTIYFFIRRAKLIESPGIAQYISLAPGEIPMADLLPQDEGASITFKAAGADSDAKQENLIRSRQTGGFSPLKDMLELCQFKRADQWLLDYTRANMTSRILVDGFWHPLDPTDRETGDAILASLKLIAGLDPVERRAVQTGQFSIASDYGKSDLQFRSQGVPTGERVQIKFAGAAKEPVDFAKLGMFPDMFEKIKSSLNQQGLTIISAPAGAGLTTSWQGALVTTDRLTRDCVGLIDDDETETVLENIVIHRYNESPGKTQLEILKTLLLTQPDMLVVPKVEDAATMDFLILQANEGKRSLAMQVQANSAAEALLRLYSQAGDRNLFLEALHDITCQRLVRRLCDDCKVEVRVQPNVIQQLGGDPRQQGTIFNQWKLPPPDQQVDEKGKPIIFPPCETCGGIGYVERIAVFELIEMTDQLREFVKKNPKIPAIEQAATKLGKKPMVQQAYRLVLSGVTSLAEVQRVFK